MTGQEAFDYGYSNGYGIAEDNWVDFSSIVKSAYDQQGSDMDTFVSECLGCESDHFRQFSPFEFYANEFNNTDYPEETWDSYDNGVLNGVVAAVKAMEAK